MPSTMRGMTRDSGLTETGGNQASLYVRVGKEGSGLGKPADGNVTFPIYPHHNHCSYVS